MKSFLLIALVLASVQFTAGQTYMTTITDYTTAACNVSTTSSADPVAGTYAANACVNPSGSITESFEVICTGGLTVVNYWPKAASCNSSNPQVYSGTQTASSSCITLWWTPAPTSPSWLPIYVTASCTAGAASVTFSALVIALLAFAATMLKQ
jgi:hypothetical protein